MTAFDALRRLEAAEDFFEALEVPYDPAALAPVRLAVLKRFGVELQSIAAWLRGSDAERVAAARAALAHAYEALRARQARAGLHRGPLVQLRRPGA